MHHHSEAKLPQVFFGDADWPGVRVVRGMAPDLVNDLDAVVGPAGGVGLGGVIRIRGVVGRVAKMLLNVVQAGAKGVCSPDVGTVRAHTLSEGLASFPHHDLPATKTRDQVDDVTAITTEVLVGWEKAPGAVRGGKVRAVDCRWTETLA